MPHFIVIYLVFINLLSLCLWGLDKNLARLVAVTGGRRDRGGHSRISRIPEKWLLILAGVGGCWGALAGALLFRHKLRKPHLLWPLAGITLLYSVLLVFSV